MDIFYESIQSITVRMEYPNIIYKITKDDLEIVTISFNCNYDEAEHGIISAEICNGPLADVTCEEYEEYGELVTSEKNYINITFTDEFLNMHESFLKDVLVHYFTFKQ